MIKDLGLLPPKVGCEPTWLYPVARVGQVSDRLLSITSDLDW